MWYSNSLNQDSKRLSTERRALSWAHLRVCSLLSAGHLPQMLQKSSKNSNHPDKRVFNLLPSGKRFRSMMAKTERLRRSFFPQATRLLNKLLVWLSTEAVAFLTPRPSLFSLLALQYCLIYWETLSALLFKLRNYGFDQLVSQRYWHHLFD